MTTNWHDQPVLLAGHRKTGTTLLISLLDDHPQLCVFPDDSAFWYGYYPRYDSDRYTDDQKVQRLVNVMLHELEGVFEKHKLGQDLLDQIPACEDAFRKRMEKLEPTPANLLANAVFAMNDVFTQRSDDQLRAWVEKTTSTEIYASDVFSWYPNAKMIHVVRDPRDNFGSLKSGWDTKYKHYNDCIERLLQSVLERGLLGLKLAAMNENRFGRHRYKVVRFEDLTTHPEQVMHELAAFIGIDWDDKLLQPTCLGRPWKGNNFEGRRFFKPTPENVGRWRKRINDQEAKVIEFHFAEELERWGYDRAFSDADCMDAAMNHYKWFNFSTQYSAGGDFDEHARVDGDGKGDG